MCGFGGFCNLSQQQKQLDAVLLEAMQQKLVHRGPDDHGTWLSQEHQLGLAHRRLSIIDVSKDGHQPMLDRSKSVVISYNGEIYNHRDLRNELEKLGYTYFSQTDTETILYAYQEWGIDFLHKLDGMFAFALFDLKKRELFLVRDRIGVKPLYFSLQQDMLSFASEIKALWELPWNTKSISQQALYHYLTFMVTPAPYTLYENVYKLPAGFYAKIDADKQMSFHEWYSPLTVLSKSSVSERKELLDERYCVDRVKELLVKATKKRMMSDVPFGAFLSGGIDSSLNVALMSQFTRKVKTFTVAFSDGPESNELKWARLIADQFDTDHHELVISEKEAFDFYEKMVYHLDEPLADCVCIPFYYVSKLAKDAGVSVVQVGEGADELFFGYPVYLKHKRFYDRVWRPSQRFLPKAMRHGVSRAAGSFMKSRAHRVDMMNNWVHQRPLLWGGAIAFSEEQKRRLFFEPRLSQDPMIKKIYAGMRQEFDSFSIVDYHGKRSQASFGSEDFCNQLLYLELKQRLPELLLMRADKMSMATGVEARVPFLDYNLIEFVLQIPPSIRCNNKQTKPLLKKVAQGLLPDAIVHRRKVGFAAPTVRWFNHGSYFPDYFARIHNEAKAKGNFFAYEGFDRSTKIDPSVLAVQKWVLQNFWALK